MAGRVVLVTGASSGFGQEIARRLAADGHVVFGTSRHARGDDGAVRMRVLDVTDDASVAACVAQVRGEAGRIDVLVNNAGNGLCGAIEDTGLDEARAQMETNFWGPVRMIQAVLPVMRAQGAGRILTVGSLAGHAALPFQAFYSTSKFALEGLNEALRLELRGSPIDSTIICPGDFRTGFTAARVYAARARAGLHAGRLARTVAIYARDEQNGADPRRVAELVARLVTVPRLRPRYLAGAASQTMSIRAKSVLPATWFESLLAGTYKL